MTTMENRPLKLHIVKGPREGDELEFKPGSRIRIGRVVRGNNVAIEDAGISSKHLSIELDPRSGTWILQDLGSSNGTFINGSSAVLSPNSPYNINDGDSITIGECTCILVRLDSFVVEASELPQNPRRRGRPAAARRNLKESEGLMKEAEESVKAAGVLKDALGLKEADEIVKGAKVLKDSGVDLISTSMKEVENIDREKERIVQAPRRARGRKRKVEDETGENNCGENKNNLGKRTRAGSGRKLNEEKDEEKLNLAAGNVNVEVSNLDEEETGQPDEMSTGKSDREKGKEAEADADVGKPDLFPSLDLTKLTVRELFDYLEVHLRKQIVDETDKSIAAMREKAERLKEYVREQRKKNSGEQSAA